MRSLFCSVLAAILYSIMGEATTVFGKVDVTPAQNFESPFAICLGDTYLKMLLPSFR